MLWVHHIGIQPFNTGRRDHFALSMDNIWFSEYDVYGWGLGLYCNCQCREENSLGTADSDFTDVQSLLLPPAFHSLLPPPPAFPVLAHPIFSLSFFTQGENEEEQNQHMKTKT